MRIHLKFEELAFDEAQDEARLTRAHVSEQNLCVSDRELRDFERGLRWGERESYGIRKERGRWLTYELGV